MTNKSLKDCKDGRERNPETMRCRKQCKEGQEIRSNGRCYQKLKEGQERSPTGRYIKKCKEGQERSPSLHCRKKCKEGQERSPSLRCRKKCQEESSRNAYGRCVKNSNLHNREQLKVNSDSDFLQRKKNERLEEVLKLKNMNYVKNNLKEWENRKEFERQNMENRKNAKTREISDSVKNIERISIQDRASKLSKLFNNNNKQLMRPNLEPLNRNQIEDTSDQPRSVIEKHRPMNFNIKTDDILKQGLDKKFRLFNQYESDDSDDDSGDDSDDETREQLNPISLERPKQYNTLSEKDDTFKLRKQSLLSQLKSVRPEIDSPSRVRKRPSQSQVRKRPSQSQVRKRPSQSQVRKRPSQSQVRRSPSKSQVRKSPSKSQVRKRPSHSQVRRSPIMLYNL
jgi:hypothetical protein